MKKALTIVKIGGNIVDDEKVLAQFLEQFAALQGYKILVHGGGKIATQLSSKLGIESRIVDGRRITGAEEIKIVTMVYAGLINKRITAMLNALGIQALGLSGVDANLIPATKRPVDKIDYGFVGDLLHDRINTSFLTSVIEKNISPVIAPITSDSKGVLLNVNADTIATSLSIALSHLFETKLALCFEKKGVLCDATDENSVIPELSSALYQQYKQQGIITKGMLPKTENAFFAAQHGVGVIIGHALDLNKKNFGTAITL
ncbi:MAG: acetylglutamate kinase [Bacteroidetes bacterium]|nr:acetylglutamate kinase [Bacteroidota bacterium]